MARNDFFAVAKLMIGVGIVVYAAIFFSTQDLQDIDYRKAFSHISTSVTITIAVSWAFNKWVWRWKPLYPWFVKIPDLSGDWAGAISPNRTEKSTDAIITKISIEQTFLTVCIKVQSAESKSISLTAAFVIDENKRQLFYTYRNTPFTSVRDTSPMHYGSVILDIESANANELSGEYWTSRYTAGQIRLQRITDSKTGTAQ